MRLANIAAFACAVISASAFEFPDFVPLHRRQEVGTAEYQCHADCGGAIVDARTDGYCDDSDFLTELSDCLDCAIEYDIWQYYGTSVAAAATACGLDATPVGSNSTSNSTSASTSSTGTTAASTSVSPPRASSSARPSSLIPSSTPTGSSTTSTTSSAVSTGGASMNVASGLVSGAIVGGFLAAFL